MAELLSKIPANLTEYPNSFKRQGCFPLEAYSVFYTSFEEVDGVKTSVKQTAKAAAEYYAANNGIAYVGQTLAAVETTTDGTIDSVTFWIIADATGTLQEVGKATSGDGKTIRLNANGKIELVGITGLDPSKTYVPSLVNGVLTWAEPDTETAEGQAAAIAALETRATSLETTVNGKAAVGNENTEGYQPAVKGLVEKLAEEIEARANADSALESKIANALKEAKEYADANDANTVYDDTALAGRVATVEGTVADHTERLTGIELFFKDAAADSTDGLTNALDTLVEIQDYISSDGQAAQNMLDAIEDNTEAITLLNNNDTVEGSVKNTVKKAIAAQAEITNAAIAEVGAVANAAAVKTDVEAALADKADKSALNNYYDKDSTYDRTTIDNKIAELVGENFDPDLTVSNLNERLTSHIETSSETFEAISAAQDTQDGAIRANTEAIAAINHETLGILAQAKTAADTAKQDAIAEAERKVNALAEDQVATNTSDIQSLTTRVNADILPIVNANKAAIDTLNGTGNGSIQKIVSDAISKIPFATEEEAGIVKASDEITVTSAGVMGIGYVSTDKIINGSMTLILNGGTASDN